MTGLNAAMKSRITEALDAAGLTQRGFSIVQESKDDFVAAIASLTYPDCRLIIRASGSEFATSESPGVHSYGTETFQRVNFDACLSAIHEWAGRIVDREESDILDEFGGVADRNPSLPTQ